MRLNYESGMSIVETPSKLLLRSTYIALAIAGILSISGCKGPGSRRTNNPEADQPVFIESASNSGLCWDIRTQDIYSDLGVAKIQQFNCAGTENQAFTFKIVYLPGPRPARLILTGYASFKLGYVEAVPASTDVNSGVFAANGGELWAVQAGPGNSAYIVHSPDDQCVELPNTSATGVQLVLNPCNGSPSQQWTFETVTDADLLRKLKARNTQ